MTIKKATQTSSTRSTKPAAARAPVPSKAREAGPKATGWVAKGATPRPAARAASARTEKPATPAAAPRTARGPALSAAEKAEVARGLEGLAFLQSLWPVKVDANKPLDAYQLMQRLPESVGDRVRGDLQPIAEGLAYTLKVLDGYRTGQNLPLGHKAPPGLLQSLPPDYGKLLAADIADSSRWLAPGVAPQLQKVVEGWNARYDHPGLTKTHPRPFHRETEYERLSAAAGVAPGKYPEASLVAAKKAWDAGERTVVFTQSIGDSTGATMGVPRTYRDEGTFLREHARAATGVFGHWQDV